MKSIEMQSWYSFNRDHKKTRHFIKRIRSHHLRVAAHQVKVQAYLDLLKNDPFFAVR